MIYGNKFLNCNTDTVNNIFNVMSNDIAFIESLDIENEFISESSVDIVHKIFDRIKDIFRRLINTCKKVINIIKSKILVMGNKLLGLLDDCLHGKYIDVSNAFDDKFADEFFEDDFEDDFFDEAFIVEESKSDNCNIYYCGYSNSSWSHAVFEESISVFKNAIDIIDKSLRAIEISDKDEMNTLADEYKDKYKSTINQIIEDGSDDIKTFHNDFNEFKSHKGTDYKSNTSNEFWWKTLNCSDRQSIEITRANIRDDLNIIINRSKLYTDTMNKTLDWERKIKYIGDRAKSIINFNTNESMTNVLNIIQDLTRASSMQYKALSLDIKIQFYESKINFENTIKLIKWFSKNRNKQDEN